MKKQTAVEFVIDEIRAHIKEYGRVDAITISALRTMGKGMEKQQIIDAYKYGNQSDVYFKPEQYYNETYGK
jgi:predicted transcriptional regulator